ncbi:MAG: sensor histidine kinase [Desulfitobacteriia bacterium]|jgi:signal transduction histidine kinase
MNLRKRLLIANASTVLIPLAITVLLGLAILFTASKLYGANFSLENYHKLAQIKHSLTGEPHSILNHKPEVFKERAFQDNLKKQLTALGGKLFFILEDRVIYATDSFTKTDLAKLMEIGLDRENAELFVLANTSYAVELIELHFSDGTKGYIGLLAPVDWSKEALRKFLISLLIIFLLSFVLTNALVSHQYYNSIITPLNNLQKAALEIGNGNLNVQIAEEGDQEIQSLCRGLELMRIKLKESIHNQLKYEDNRKLLVSSISHDLKTPVTSIKGYVEGILDGVATTPEKTEKYLRTIYQKAEQMDQMIDDLLIYAKLDLKQLPFDFQRTDLRQYIETYLNQVRPELEQQGIILSFENLSKPALVQLDRERMQRVLDNILDNSKKHLDKLPPKISIILRETHTSITIEIKDNGSGIKDRDLPHVFDRFYRADESRGRIKGSGLGLAIAKQIVEGHQGKIWAVGHQREGTSIMISLPKEKGREKWKKY